MRRNDTNEVSWGGVAVLSAVDRGFIAFNKWVLVALMAAMTALVFLNVVARYVFGVSFGWAEELSRFAMIWTAFLGVGLALRHGQLVAVEALQDALPPALATALRAFGALVVGGFLLALVLLGIEFVEFSWRNRTPVLRLPRGLPYLAIPIGAAFALLHLLLGFAAHLRREPLALPEIDRDAGAVDRPAPAAGDARAGPA